MNIIKKINNIMSQYQFKSYKKTDYHYIYMNTYNKQNTLEIIFNHKYLYCIIENKKFNIEIKKLNSNKKIDFYIKKILLIKRIIYKYSFLKEEIDYTINIDYLLNNQYIYLKDIEKKLNKKELELMNMLYS